MDTLRVDICYRPLRIGWAIGAGDIEAFRSSVRLSYALWGGRFNPILIADREDETKRLVDLFRVDVILPIGEGEKVKALQAKFSSPTRSLSGVLTSRSAPRPSMSTTRSGTCAIGRGGTASKRREFDSMRGSRTTR